MADLPSGAVTFVFTDIEGSTQLVRQLRGRYAEVLGEHQRLLREAFTQHGGYEIDTQGDAFFYAFPSAHEAVLAAVEGQRALAGYPWPDGARVRVRIGIHTGQAAPVNGRYTGLAVHRAARICAAGHGGQILVSQSTQSLLEDEDLAVSLSDLGDQRLKDIERPVRVYQVAAAGLPAEFPPLRREEEPPEVAPGPVPLYRRLVLLGALAVVAAALAGVTALLLTRDAGGLPGVKPNHVGIIDPETNEIVAEVPVGPDPGAITSAGEAVWVASTGARTVSRIDPETSVVDKTIPVGATPTGVAFTPGAVWVVHGLLGTVSRVDPRFDNVTTVDTRVGRTSGGSIAAGPSGVWVALAGRAISYVGHIDPSSDKVDKKGFPAGRPSAIAVSEDAVWVANGGDASTVSRLDPRTALILDEELTVGRGPRAIAVGEGAAWVANGLGDTVTRVDSTGDGVEATIPVGDEPSAVAVGGGAVWVANAGAGTVSRIEPDTNIVTATIDVGGRPEGLALGAGVVWVSVQAP